MILSYRIKTRLAVTGAQLPNITIAKSADVVYICHPKYRQKKNILYGDQDWRYQTLSFVPEIQQ